MKFRLLLPALLAIAAAATAQTPPEEAPEVDIQLSAWLIDTTENFAVRDDGLPTDLLLTGSDLSPQALRLFHSSETPVINYKGPLPLHFYARSAPPAEDGSVPPVASIEALPSPTGRFLFLFLPRGDRYETLAVPAFDTSSKPGTAAILNLSNEKFAIKLGDKLETVAPAERLALPIPSTSDHRVELQLALFSERHGEWRRFYQWKYRLTPTDRALFLVYRKNGNSGTWRVMPIVHPEVPASPTQPPATP